MPVAAFNNLHSSFSGMCSLSLEARQNKMKQASYLVRGSGDRQWPQTWHGLCGVRHGDRQTQTWTSDPFPSASHLQTDSFPQLTLDYCLVGDYQTSSRHFLHCVPGDLSPFLPHYSQGKCVCVSFRPQTHDRWPSSLLVSFFPGCVIVWNSQTCYYYYHSGVGL